MRTYLYILLMVSFASNAIGQNLNDKKATRQTRALYANLFTIAEDGFMFGHQDDDAYGVGWTEVEGRSDVKSVTGSYPAVHGWDLGHIEIGKSENLDRVKFDKMRNWIVQTYKRGGISTISWHGNNPVSKKNAWDKTPAVKDILPGGSLHNEFKGQLDLVATFLKSCKAGTKAVPIIFRPYHEHNGDWFWWGKGNCTEEEYIKLWQFTVEYLRDVQKVHNLIYAFSPDRGRWNFEDGKKGYLYGYPGDDYIDIIGLDNYGDVRDTTSRDDLVKGLSLITEIAKEKNKVAVLSETGLEALKHDKWFTQIVLNPIKESPQIRIAYVMVWRNAHNRENHFYAPYPGHPTENDFKTFYADKKTFFESDLENMYKKKKTKKKK